MPQVVVCVNVYDLSEVNEYTRPLGFGIFHSGLVVHGREFSFGGHDYASSGIFETAPKAAPAPAIFREMVVVGTTEMNPGEVSNLVGDMDDDFHGNTYHLLGAQPLRGGAVLRAHGEDAAGLDQQAGEDGGRRQLVRAVHTTREHTGGRGYPLGAPASQRGAVHDEDWGWGYLWWEPGGRWRGRGVRSTSRRGERGRRRSAVAEYVVGTVGRAAKRDWRALTPTCWLYCRSRLLC